MIGKAQFKDFAQFSTWYIDKYTEQMSLFDIYWKQKEHKK